MSDQVEVRARAIAEELKLSESNIARRFKLLAFGPEDERNIAAARPIIEPHVDKLAQQFFENLAAQEESAALMSRTAFVNEARRLKRDHLGAFVRRQYGRIKLGLL